MRRVPEGRHIPADAVSLQHGVSHAGSLASCEPAFVTTTEFIIHLLICHNRNSGGQQHKSDPQ
jgi:hypothetical protein